MLAFETSSPLMSVCVCRGQRCVEWHVIALFVSHIRTDGWFEVTMNRYDWDYQIETLTFTSQLIRLSHFAKINFPTRWASHGAEGFPEIVGPDWIDLDVEVSLAWLSELEASSPLSLSARWYVTRNRIEGAWFQFHKQTSQTMSK